MRRTPDFLPDSRRTIDGRASSITGVFLIRMAPACGDNLALTFGDGLGDGRAFGMNVAWKHLACLHAFLVMIDLMQDVARYPNLYILLELQLSSAVILKRVYIEMR